MRGLGREPKSPISDMRAPHQAPDVFGKRKRREGRERKERKGKGREEKEGRREGEKEKGERRREVYGELCSGEEEVRTGTVLP
jgi:hypothetical protein